MPVMHGDRWVLQQPGAQIQLRDPGSDRVLMSVRTATWEGAARVGARLARDAVVAAATWGAREVDTVLDGTSPTCGIVLESLRDLIGGEVDAVIMRRAGSSVFVTLRLTRRPRPPAAPVTRPRSRASLAHVEGLRRTGVEPGAGRPSCPAPVDASQRTAARLDLGL
ncbi:hypothetical protein [Cellulomonas sp. ATA003]|uniref:hypothetical protein n=1 Tax=Cellulomonas sp. ATA003 TaxID=3073064 RepID=UPI002873770E|nr:hypothetical protein [Cellulomonas sp. ATA003]WNB87667.1 hypothetical protein REH70_07425 [Cellulomonas sp. ATA003]